MSRIRPRRIVTVFAKRPVAGQVKTRLCPPLDPELAARFARAMLDDSLRKLGSSSSFQTRLRVAPAEELDWFRERYPDVPVEAQEGAGLGERLTHHFDHVLLAEERHLVVGSEAPHLPTSRLLAGFEALENGAELVLGPDRGGGYDLVGLARPFPELFTEVPMSTGDMCAATIELARASGWETAVLGEGYDLDQAEDLLRLARDLFEEGLVSSDSPDYPLRTAELLAAHREDLQR